MKKYGTEFKLEIVQCFLAGEGGGKLLARRCSVPEEKIRTWVSHYRLHGVDGLQALSEAVEAGEVESSETSLITPSWERSRLRSICSILKVKT